MSRLTEKVKNTDDYIKLPTKDKQEFINKLGKLEDLEEQIGCPLEVFVKALKEGIYQEDGGRRRFPFIEYNSATDKFFFGFGTYCNVEDYKKTWFLKEDRSE